MYLDLLPQQKQNHPTKLNRGQIIHQHFPCGRQFVKVNQIICFLYVSAFVSPADAAESFVWQKLQGMYEVGLIVFMLAGVCVNALKDTYEIRLLKTFYVDTFSQHSRRSLLNQHESVSSRSLSFSSRMRSPW